MKLNSYLKIIVSVLVYLIVSLPFVFAQELNLQYDAVGNLVTGDNFYREYDGFNHLLRIRQGNSGSGNITEEFIWHPLEERVFIKKVYWANQTLRTTIKYLNKNTIKIKNESGTFYENYIYQDDILVAQRDANGNKYAIHNDHLGSVSLITDSNGNVIENEFFSPYGEQLQPVKASRFSFTGKEFDSLTGQYDLKSRMTKPEWANRPITPDRIFYDFTKYEDERIKSYYNPQGLNPYSYALNNPYKYVDPGGRFAIEIFGRFLLQLVISMGVSEAAEQQYKEYKATVPENEQNKFLEDIYQLTKPTDVAVTGSQAEIIISRGTRHAYRTKAYRLLSKISNILTGADVAFYFYFKSQTNYYRNQINREANKIALEVRENLIQQMRWEGSSKAVFGSSGGSGFVSGIGYVTSGGRTYPTTNPNFVPNPNVPRVCISGC